MFRRILSMLLVAMALCVQVPSSPVAEEQNATVSIAPSGIATADDTLYVADSYARVIWMVADDGTPAVWAGQTSVTDASGRPVGGYNDGAFSDAAFEEPWAIVPYADGFLVSDCGNHVIRYLDTAAEQVYTVAGAGTAGYADGSGNSAAFDSPTGLAVGDDGTIYIADTGNHAIRAMDSSGKVTTLAGGEEGCALGSLSDARFSQPTGLCYANGVLYVADSGNHRIAAIADGQQPNLSSIPRALVLSNDTLYVGDVFSQVLLQYSIGADTAVLLDSMAQSIPYLGSLLSFLSWSF